MSQLPSYSAGCQPTFPSLLPPLFLNPVAYLWPKRRVWHLALLNLVQLASFTRSFCKSFLPFIRPTPLHSLVRSVNLLRVYLVIEGDQVDQAGPAFPKPFCIFLGCEYMRRWNLLKGRLVKLLLEIWCFSLKNCSLLYFIVYFFTSCLLLYFIVL